MSETNERPQRVQLFVTCMVEALRPQAGLAVVDILEGQGLTVAFPQGQTCCGQPAFNAGSWGDAAAMARHTLDVLSESTAPVVAPSGSCVDMIRHHYPHLLKDDPVYGPLAQEVARRTYEFSEFMVEVLEVTDVGATGNGRVAYHPSCHLLRGLSVTRPPRELLGHVEGLEVVPIEDERECCGFGGLFAVKMSEISGAMLDKKLDAIEATGATAVIGCDASCLVHIAGGLHRRGSTIETLHLAEVLTQ